MKFNNHEPRSKGESGKLWQFAKRLDKTKEEIASLAQQVSGYRTSSTKELTSAECKQAIHLLQQEWIRLEPSVKAMRSKILHLAKKAFGWEFYPDSSDWGAFNAFMKKSGVHKKLLFNLSYQQLHDSVSQWEKIAKNEEHRGAN